MNHTTLAVAATGLCLALLYAPGAAAQNYSTGAVNTYGTCGAGPDLGLPIEEARRFRHWYNLAGFPIVSRWEEDDVWNTDFTDGAGKDMEPQGGSDLPNIYLFTGHGICQNPPNATDPDFLVTCSHGALGTTDIGADSRWGNSGGRLQFMFIDASCPMDLASLGHNWFPPFRGLHIATGHSGNAAHDTLDSASRGADFAAHTIGVQTTFLGIVISTIPREPVTWAWMHTGIEDVQDQVCAVAVANDATRDAAVSRRDNEYVSPAWGRPSGNWYAWRWICK
ncbi:MAG: DUF6345 domain-containing protein [Rhodanobacteraceae bacterium]